jgi:hypothetical protein
MLKPEQMMARLLIQVLRNPNALADVDGWTNNSAVGVLEHIANNTHYWP